METKAPTAQQAAVIAAIKAGGKIAPRYRTLNPKRYGVGADGAPIQSMTGHYLTNPDGSETRLNDNLRLRPIIETAAAGRIYWSASNASGTEGARRIFGTYIAADLDTLRARYDKLRADKGGEGWALEVWTRSGSRFAGFGIYRNL